MAAGRNDSVFFNVLKALRRGRRIITPDPSIQRSVLTGVNMPKETSQTVQQMQQDFLDVQSFKIAHDLYSRSVYYDADRLTSYQDYRAMDLSPEVAAALDIMSDEIVTKNERGEILAVYSENVRVKKILNDLFMNVLNIDFNLSYWARECLKFGDMFLKLEIDQEKGVFDARMLPPSEIHREEGWDGNINSARFRWETNNMYFEEWQVAHFRIPGDGSRLPYGTSVLSPARKLWKQLQLAEDAMLVYRVIRAPERRVYYIEVGNLDPADVPQYIEKVKREIKKSPVVNESSGNINFKFNPITHEEDYFLPIRGDKSSRVETLPGAANLDAIADVEYLQNKLFAALKVPKPYLNYAETIPGGSALAQADLRFSRTINRLQEALLIELRRVANIHLYFLGFEDDLDNFRLALTNPSTQQELLKLEVMKARIEVFKEMFTNDATSPVSYTWAMQYIMGFSESEIKQILRQKKVEKKMFSEIDQAIDEYLETGIFAELDSKFRRPGFVPGQAPTAPPAEGGDAGAGGGGGFGGGGTLGGLGGGLGGGAEVGATPEAGAEVGAGPEVGAGGAEVGAEAGEEVAPEPLAESTKLLKKNGVMQAKTRILLENMEKKLQALNESVEDSETEKTE
jgi:hypothetical protein